MFFDHGQFVIPAINRVQQQQEFLCDASANIKMLLTFPRAVILLSFFGSGKCQSYRCTINCALGWSMNVGVCLDSRTLDHMWCGPSGFSALFRANTVKLRTI